MSFLTGTNTEAIYASTASGNRNTFTTEVQINNVAAGMGTQAHLPPDFWLPNKSQVGRGIFIRASGIVSSTATPSYTWTVRLGAAGITGPIILGSAALATATGISAVPWHLEGWFILEAIADAGGNSTGRGVGTLLMDGYAAATTTRFYQLWGGAASPGTVATVDTSVTNYINLNVTCTASSASNTITCHQLVVLGLN